jgi:hypothetical protein
VLSHFNPMSVREQASKEIVLKLLREAFPSLAERRDLTPLTHQECVAMRSQMPALSDRDLPFCLREVLEDLLDSHTGKIGDTEDAEAVVQWLDVSRAGADLKAIEEIYGEDGLKKYLQDQEFLKQAGQEAFASFTPDQANAISEWLKHANEWPEMKWYEADFNSALVYWQSRVRQGT